MVNYKQAIVYKICCDDVNIKDIYVGSTTNFSRRKHQHKSVCNNEYNKGHGYRVYRFIDEHGGWKNWTMVEIEVFEATNKRDLHARE
jgi:predicted GIY-YIG superfamily endonuclease